MPLYCHHLSCIFLNFFWQDDFYSNLTITEMNLVHNFENFANSCMNLLYHVLFFLINYLIHTHTRVNCKKKKTNKLANKVQMKKNGSQVAFYVKNFVKLYKIWFLTIKNNYFSDRIIWLNLPSAPIRRSYKE